MNNFKKLRLWLGLTAPEFARKIGIQTATLYTYENGTRSPSLETLQKISKATGLTIDQIVNFELVPLERSKEK